ncbi:MAG: DUF4367 domain-containing protein [Oscillospiraceae bacterium]|jgi:hypothetical protein|nr:DUF4367 domain-containing protein [Oscillospiraceae bacterium]
MSGNFDDLLSAAFSEAFDEEIKAVEQMKKVKPSKQLKGVVLGLCKKEKPRAVWHFQSALKRCAVFVLVFFSTASLLMLTAPEVRAAVQQVILKWTDRALLFSFEGKSTSDAVSVDVSFIPDGYTLTDTFDALPDMFTYTWNNDEGREIYLSCAQISPELNQGIDNEHGTLTDIAFSAQDVVYIKSNTPGWPSFLTWTQDGYSMLLDCPANFSEEMIIKIAEGIELNY